MHDSFLFLLEYQTYCISTGNSRGRQSEITFPLSDNFTGVHWQWRLRGGAVVMYWLSLCDDRADVLFWCFCQLELDVSRSGSSRWHLGTNDSINWYVSILLEFAKSTLMVYEEVCETWVIKQGLAEEKVPSVSNVLTIQVLKYIIIYFSISE